MVNIIQRNHCEDRLRDRWDRRRAAVDVASNSQRPGSWPRPGRSGPAAPLTSTASCPTAHPSPTPSPGWPGTTGTSAPSGPDSTTRWPGVTSNWSCSAAAAKFLEQLGLGCGHARLTAVAIPACSDRRQSAAGVNGCPASRKGRHANPALPAAGLGGRRITPGGSRASCRDRPDGVIQRLRRLRGETGITPPGVEHLTA